MVESYRDLVAWQKAMGLALGIYEATRKLPDSEKFGLTSQLRRAAVSVPSVLAEGHARSSTKEFVRYVSMAMGSPAEIETQLMIAKKLGFLDEGVVDPLLASCSEQGRVMRGLKKSLELKLAARSNITP
jgi:four helix bundle protein